MPSETRQADLHRAGTSCSCLATPVPPSLCALTLDNFDHGCRSQQFRIHEKESWEEVSDADKGIMIAKEALTGGYFAVGAVMESSSAG